MATIEHNGYTIVDGMLQLDDLRVEGSLTLEGCAELTALPEGLSVSRWLNLERCTALAALPDGLSAGGSLFLNGCTSLTALPERLSVGEDLYLRYCTALTNLPDGLIVEGWLNLVGCTALTALPDGLSAGRSLFLNGCTALTALPDDLSVGECLYLNDCTALTALPNGLSVEGSIDLEGCTALTAIPDDLSVGRSIFLSKIWLSSNEAILRKVSLPESIRTAAIGRRLGDLVDHWALSWNGMRDQIIESIEEDANGDLVFRLRPHADVGLSGSEESTSSFAAYSSLLRSSSATRFLRLLTSIARSLTSLRMRA